MKRAQIQMTETIAVLFIFFILVFFGLVFYYKYVDSSVKENQEQALEKRAIDTTTRVIFLPEVQCSSGSSGGNVYCLDVLKLEAFGKLPTKVIDDYYFSLFSFATITVKEVYPNPSHLWVLYSKPKNDYTSRKVTYFGAALENMGIIAGNPVTAFGYVTVEVYS